ncbi:MAG: peptidoglycan DD-metalloendopeptidase family protein [bacterium]|nr:peptidoglycan DD-metalloendopeptidase family protein [bacterium]
MISNMIGKPGEGTTSSMGVDLRSLESMSNAPDEEKIKRAAIQFEQMLIDTLLKSAFKEPEKDEDGESGLSFLSGSYSNKIGSMLFSQHISDNGGLGYQEIISQQIKDLKQGNGNKDKASTQELPKAAVSQLKERMISKYLEENPTGKVDNPKVAKVLDSLRATDKKSYMDALNASQQGTGQSKGKDSAILNKPVDAFFKNRVKGILDSAREQVKQLSEDRNGQLFDQRNRQLSNEQVKEPEVVKPVAGNVDYPLKVTMPVSGDVTSDFGWRKDPIDGKTRFHSGVDLRVRPHTPVKSFMEGEVVFSGWKKGYGHLVEVKHPNGYYSRYGHNAELSVKKGDYIKSGDVVALSGSSGRSTGPHLHFEVRKGDYALDPVKILNRLEGVMAKN